MSSDSASICAKQKITTKSLFGKTGLIGATLLGSALILVVGVQSARWFAFHLPSDDYARRHFLKHREDYLRFVALLKNDEGVRTIDSNGDVNSDGLKGGRHVPEYEEVLKKIGARSVLVRDDGAVDFQLWGSGGAIVSDSYKGVRFAGAKSPRSTSGGWMPVPVTSLEDDKLPQENNKVATGYYILPIEPNWSVYRFEYQE